MYNLLMTRFHKSDIWMLSPEQPQVTSKSHNLILVPEWKVYDHVIQTNTYCHEIPPWSGHLFIWGISFSTQQWWINQLVFGILAWQRRPKSIIQLLLISGQARSPPRVQWQMADLKQQVLVSISQISLSRRSDR